MLSEPKILPQRPDKRDKIIAFVAFVLLVLIVTPIEEIALWEVFAKRLRKRKFL